MNESRSKSPICVAPHCGGGIITRYQLAEFDVVQCTRCRLLYRHPFPSADELRQMYDDPAYLSSTYFSGQSRGARSRERPEMRAYREGLDWLDRHIPPGDTSRSLLDVGCGTGFFLSLAGGRGWDVHGVEISRGHSATAKREFGIDVFCGDFADSSFEPSSFDAITMWDVLEHVENPSNTLAQARELLKAEGRLVVFTINASSLFNTLAHWCYRSTLGAADRAIELLYDKRHNYYFTDRSLTALLSKAGFEVQKRMPYRAHLGRWLSEPAPKWLLAGAELVDWASVPLGLQYRQSVFCRKDGKAPLGTPRERTKTAKKPHE